MRNLIWLIALFICVCAFAPVQAEQSRSIRVEVRRQRTRDDVAILSLIVNDRSALRLPRANAPSGSLERRLSAAATVLSRAYRADELDFAVQENDEGHAELLLNGELVLSASPDEAALLGQSAIELAALWQRNLELALGLEAEAAEPAADSGSNGSNGAQESAERFSMKDVPQGDPESAQEGTAEENPEGGAAQPEAKAKTQPKTQPKTEPKAPTGGKAGAKARPAQPQDQTNADGGDESAEPKYVQTSTGRVGLGGVQDISLSALAPDPAFQRLMVSLGHRPYEPPLETRYNSISAPAELTAVVTGPASEDAARIAVEWALRAQAGVPLSSRVSWRGALLSPEEIAELPKARLKEMKALFGDQPLRADVPILATAPGKSRTVSLDYTISSIGEPVSGIAKVKIENRGFKLPRESYTWFSNAPEGVKQPQLLYYADLPVGVSGRLVYHHQNQGDQNLQFFARLVNETSEVGAVHVIPGSCAPDINTYFVGYKSCENFWANLNTGAGYVLRIPPGAQALLVGQALPRGYTSSGYYKLTNLASCNLRIETVVLEAGHFPAEHAYSRTDLASSMVYPEPYYSESREWSTGDDWLYLRLGQNAPQDLAGRTILHGMYGMTHSYTVDVTNTRSTPATVYVVLRGSAGEVKGQFFINDKYVVSQLVKGGDEQLMDQVTLQPGASKRLKIVGIPLNGGFYPASIIIRDTKMP
ncbi:hypothetical protein IT575_07490 [bacterium]|nr:hypothetical protein [bacterium]